MSRAIVEAVKRLQGDGALNDRQAAHLLRIARGELISVRFELQALLYAGVLLIAAGVGILVKEHIKEIGPLTIGFSIALASAACFFYAFRRSPAFTWGEVPSPTLAFDYILLLGVLLLGSDLAYLETQFKFLGSNWPYHLLIVSVIYLAAAYRFDSRGVLTLAMTSFAAWRGISLSLNHAMTMADASSRVRANAILVGALYMAAALYSTSRDRKAHFEPVYGNLGLILFLGGLYSGIIEEPPSITWAFFLFAASGIVIRLSYRLRRTQYFTLGVIAGYLGILRFLFHAIPDAGGFFVVTISSLAVLGAVLAAQRRMKERP